MIDGYGWGIEVEAFDGFSVRAHPAGWSVVAIHKSGTEFTVVDWLMDRAEATEMVEKLVAKKLGLE